MPNIAKKGYNGGQIWPNSDGDSWDPLFGRMQVVGNDYPVEYNYTRLTPLSRILHYPVTNLTSANGGSSGKCSHCTLGEAHRIRMKIVRAANRQP